MFLFPLYQISIFLLFFFFYTIRLYALSLFLYYISRLKMRVK